MKTTTWISISLMALVAAGTARPAAAQGPRRGAQPGRPAWSSRPPSVVLERLPSTPEQMQRAADRVVPRPASASSRPPSVVLDRLPSRPEHVQEAADRVTAARPQQNRWSMETVRGPRRVTVVNPSGRAAAGGVRVAGARAGAAAAGVAAGGTACVAGSVIGQEIADPGKTSRDIQRLHIEPDWTELGACGASVAVTAAAVTGGVAAVPAVIVGVAAGGAVLIIDQEIKDPGKTSRDIKRMTGIDLKKTGKDIDNAVRNIFGGV